MMQRDEVSMAERARQVAVKEMHRWWKTEREVLQKAADESDYCKLMASYIEHIQRRAGFNGMDRVTDALVKRMVPELQTFIVCFDRLQKELLPVPSRSPSPTTPTVTPDVRRVAGGARNRVEDESGILVRRTASQTENLP